MYIQLVWFGLLYLILKKGKYNANIIIIISVSPRILAREKGLCVRMLVRFFLLIRLLLARF